MRRGLTLGAYICCAIGVAVFAITISEVVYMWKDIGPYQYENVAIGFFLTMGYVLLALLPVFMIFQFRWSKNLNWRFLSIGLVEVVVLLTFLGSLFLVFPSL